MWGGLGLLTSPKPGRSDHSKARGATIVKRPGAHARIGTRVRIKFSGDTLSFTASSDFIFYGYRDDFLL